MEKTYTLDSNEWSGQLLEDITHYIESELELLPPKQPTIKVNVKVIEKDSRGS